jgi:hypothetical protein
MRGKGQRAGLPGAEKVFEGGEESAELAVDEDEQQGTLHQLGRAVREPGSQAAVWGGGCCHGGKII